MVNRDLSLSSYFREKRRAKKLLSGGAGRGSGPGMMTASPAFAFFALMKNLFYQEER